jgi:hypothetical protein
VPVPDEGQRDMRILLQVRSADLPQNEVGDRMHTTAIMIRLAREWQSDWPQELSESTPW